MTRQFQTANTDPSKKEDLWQIELNPKLAYIQSGDDLEIEVKVFKHQQTWGNDICEYFESIDDLVWEFEGDNFEVKEIEAGRYLLQSTGEGSLSLKVYHPEIKELNTSGSIFFINGSLPPYSRPSPSDC